MWFKHVTLYRFTKPLRMDQQTLSDALGPLSFSPCLPALPSSLGWVSPIENIDNQLVYGGKRFWMICLQFEDKILPASVIRQAVDEKVLEIEQKEARVVRGKEKKSLKDDIIQTLLPKAFTKKSRVYAYLDLDQQQLVINSNTPAKIERFVAFLKRAITHADIKSFEIKKPAAVMTDWLKQNNFPVHFALGQSCVLQDPQQERRIIRCQHQDLLAQCIQDLIKDGCDITQLALHWKEHIQFSLCANFSLKNIKFEEAVLAVSNSDYTETEAQRFDADFVMMTEMLSQLLVDLLFEFSSHVITSAAIEMA